MPLLLWPISFFGAIFILQLPLGTSGLGFENPGASCRSNEYCPGGWSVLRRPHDYSAHTCNPADQKRAKCPKPYMCVAAKCGISFCCGSDKMLDKLKEQESAERENREDEEEEKKRLAEAEEKRKAEEPEPAEGMKRKEEETKAEGMKRKEEETTAEGMKRKEEETTAEGMKHPEEHEWEGVKRKEEKTKAEGVMNPEESKAEGMKRKEEEKTAEESVDDTAEEL